MKHIWKVTVQFEEDIEGEVLEDFYQFNIEAINDLEARKKGIKCAKQKVNEFIQIRYVEIEHRLEFED